MRRENATSLHEAVETGDMAAVERLLAAGIPVDARDERGFTPLYVATMEERAEIVELLLNRGADVSPKTRGSWTPLHWTAYSGSADIARLLIARGAQVDATDSTGATPLQYAARRGCDEMVDLLLSHGAATSPRDRDGAVAVRLAAQQGHRAVLALLRRCRAEGRARIFRSAAIGAIAGGILGFLAASPLALLDDEWGFFLPVLFGLPPGACIGATIASLRSHPESTSLGCSAAFAAWAAYLVGAYLFLLLGQELPLGEWPEALGWAVWLALLFTAGALGAALPALGAWAGALLSGRRNP